MPVGIDPKVDFAFKWVFGRDRPLNHYWARLYPQTLTTGENYEALRPTVVICFLNDVLWAEHPQQYHWHFQVRDVQTPVVLTPHLAIHVLELPKFRRAVEELGGPLEQWLYFLRHAEELDPTHWPEQLQVVEIRQAVEELNMLSQDELERERYEARMRVQRDESVRANAARIFHETGVKEGIEIGMEKGRKEGWVDTIQCLQQVSKRDLTPREELLALSPENLQALVEQMKREVLGKTFVLE